jgi:hypothetical protein
MWRTVLLLLAMAVAGCSRNIEVEKVIRVTDIHTGWYDAGIQPDRMNKLVPSISLRLENLSAEAIRSVQLVAIFRQVSEPTVAWGEHYARAIDRDGLAPGSSTKPIVLRSNLGYTGSQPRMQMLQNREFVDAKVEVFARHGSRALAKLGEYTIDRQLLTQ